MKCCVCDKELYDPKRWFCYKCYTTYKDSILNKVEWTKYLQNAEAKRRRDEKRDSVLIYLGDDDIAEINGTNRIVRTYNEVK